MKSKTSILITGCSSGIGYTVALELHQAGYQVFASCRKQEDVRRLKNLGLNCVQLDITDNNSINLALENILQLTNGRLDAVFNNAGFAVPGAVEDLTKEALLKQFDTNVFGYLELTNRIIPVMRAQGGGKIIVNSSILGFISLRYRGAYNASKHALQGLFDTLRLELKNTSIHVSIIQPGPITSKFRNNAHGSFIENINTNNSVHSKNYDSMNKKYAKKHKSELFEQPPSAVTKRIINILNSSRPRAYYSVTFPTYLFRFLVRLLPTRTLDYILYKITAAETDF